MIRTPLVPRLRAAFAARFTLALLLAGAGALPARLAAAEAGSVTGTVTSKSTGNGLIGARVDVAGTQLSALVDNTGRYLLPTVPAGTHELVVTFTGLDEQRSTVVVTAGQAATRDFVMSSSIYVLDAFKVASEKEGLSSALTQQRNADNLKSVASMDALRDLPNMNATELAIRLPGVTFASPGDEVVEIVSVRGTGAGMTSITIDGGGMSSFSAQARTTRMTAFTGAMFEALEVVKGQTPDRPVDSLGGNVNFKTHSPLSMREKRRVSYSFTRALGPHVHRAGALAPRPTQPRALQLPVPGEVRGARQPNRKPRGLRQRILQRKRLRLLPDEPGLPADQCHARLCVGLPHAG
jgi:hypothetical protein